MLLAGARAIPQLAAGAVNRLGRAVTVPAAAPAGTYYLLACADDRQLVNESDETINCRASTTTMRVT